MEDDAPDDGVSAEVFAVEGGSGGEIAPVVGPDRFGVQLTAVPGGELIRRS